jgi:hypothetical protein
VSGLPAQILRNVSTPLSIFNRINLRERSSRPTATEHSEGQDKHHDLRSTVQSGGDDVVILDEKLGALPSQIVLREKAESEEHRDSRVDTHEEVTHLPQDNRGVDVAEGWVRVEAVGEPKGNWYKESQQVRDRHPLVLGADGECVRCDTPGDSKCVELLDVLAGPDVGASKTFQDGSLVVDDSGHVSVLRGKNV